MYFISSRTLPSTDVFSTLPRVGRPLCAPLAIITSYNQWPKTHPTGRLCYALSPKNARVLFVFSPRTRVEGFFHNGRAQERCCGPRNVFCLHLKGWLMQGVCPLGHARVANPSSSASRHTPRLRALSGRPVKYQHHARIYNFNSL